MNVLFFSIHVDMFYTIHDILAWNLNCEIMKKNIVTNNMWYFINKGVLKIGWCDYHHCGNELFPSTLKICQGICNYVFLLHFFFLALKINQRMKEI